MHTITLESEKLPFEGSKCPFNSGFPFTSIECNFTLEMFPEILTRANIDLKGLSRSNFDQITNTVMQSWKIDNPTKITSRPCTFHKCPIYGKEFDRNGHIIGGI